MPEIILTLFILISSLVVLGIVSVIKPIVVNTNLVFIPGMIMIGFTLVFLLFVTATDKLERGSVLFCSSAA